MAMAMTNTALAFFLLVAAASFLSLPPPSLAVTSPYVRPKPRATLSLLKDDDDGRKPEQQIKPLVGVFNWPAARVRVRFQYGPRGNNYCKHATPLYCHGTAHDTIRRHS
ncbi:hypothetical protein OsI_35137 [Oryza sativa Indica Group]|uniref:Uncharacterized protein n=1 Tax=Oryza sativa subsp. indica TaxID=39946 RepID=A2ZBI8_ORYSI|nr:hypothetical protein OsI_35137 [Oryza sativa Indica Group]